MKDFFYTVKHHNILFLLNLLTYVLSKIYCVNNALVLFTNHTFQKQKRNDSIETA